MSGLGIHELTVALDHVPVLHAVSCAVPGGGWLALIGPNGAGKTTLLRAVAGLVPYQAGSRSTGLTSARCAAAAAPASSPTCRSSRCCPRT